MNKLGFASPVLGMNKKAAIWMAIVGGVLAVAVPIVFSMYWAWKRNLGIQIEFTDSIAREVLRKSGEGVSQMDAIHTALVNAGEPEPCSPESIRLMGTLNLKSDQVQVVGYVQDNTLLCSAYGRQNVALGAPAFTTPLGTKVWTGQDFPEVPNTKFLVLAPKGLGYAVVMLPKTFLNVFTDDPNISVGLYSLSSGRLIAGRGEFESDWFERLGEAQQVQFIDNAHFVVVRRSSEFEFASFAAQPVTQVAQGMYKTAFVLVPIGILAGLLLSLTVVHLARQQLTLPAVLKVALKRKEFTLFYQPVVDLQTGQWMGAEALIRWRRPTGEMVPPDVFIRAAEEAGLIQEMTAQVMELVGRDARQFFQEHPHFHIAINLAAADLESHDTIAGLTRLSRETGAGAHNLLVEATERGFMKADVARDILREIRSMGIGVAIDDFGTGYSSLSYLATFELDFLKIDKSFVDTVGKNSATSQVVPHIIQMAKALNLTMIAEGVETLEQAQYLREHGVQFAQGWLFAKPMPFAELLAGLAERGTEHVCTAPKTA